MLRIWIVPLTVFLLARGWHDWGGGSPWRPGGPTVKIDADHDGVGARLDCDDHNADVYPGADEICDGLDNDCDGTTVDPVADWYTDADGDGYGSDEIAATACTGPAGTVANHDDCDDANPDAYPGADEICNGLDDDCDSTADEGLTTTIRYRDADGDGLGVSPASVGCLGDGYVPTKGDCDDTDPDIGAAPTWYWDVDQDGYGRESTTWVACTAPSVYWAETSGDCDDGDSSIYPGAAEVCDDQDDDCDDLVDEEDPDLSDAVDWYTDADGDGHGSDEVAMTACTMSAGTAAAADDCDDANPDVYAGAEEVCDSVDNDCDGLVDEDDPDLSDAVDWYTDADGDGYGSSDLAASACTGPADTVANDDDCDDEDSATHPGAAEACDGMDNDCDGKSDEGLTTTIRYSDADGDGLGVSPPSLGCLGDGYVATGGDCDDTDPDIGAASTWYWDADGDGYGLESKTLVYCTAFSKYSAETSGDCDDGDKSIYPGANEVCDDQDDDCDDLVDEDDPDLSDAVDWYTDADGDGHGSDEVATTACSMSAGTAATADDCDEAEPDVYPGAEEDLGDGVDQDCDGITDELQVDGSTYTLPEGDYLPTFVEVTGGGTLVVSGTTSILTSSIWVDATSTITGTGEGSPSASSCGAGTGAFDGGGGGGGSSAVGAGGDGGSGGWTGGAGSGGDAGTVSPGCNGGGPTGAKGGAAGATLSLTADLLTLEGGISLDGADGSKPRVDDGGGGGGGGGTLTVSATVLSLSASTSSLSAHGGDGAAGGSAYNAGGGGGGGGAGGSLSLTADEVEVDGVTVSSLDLSAYAEVRGGEGGSGGHGSDADGVPGSDGEEGTALSP